MINLPLKAKKKEFFKIDFSLLHSIRLLLLVIGFDFNINYLHE